MSDKHSEKRTVETVRVIETCSKCRLPITPTERKTSFTAFLFSNLRCKCEVAAPVQSLTDDTREGEHTEDASPYRSTAPLDRPDLGERYEVLAMIGQGGMGSVWKVRDRETDKTLAAKILRLELALDRVAVRRFELEVQAAAGLIHPNLVVVYDSGIAASGAPYLLMDFLEGKSLAEVLSKEVFIEPCRVIDMAIQVCQALSLAHSKNIVHRDVKPSNIILTAGEGGKDFAKLVDFGIAKLVPTVNTQTNNLTQTGDLFGSPLYMSPEQCRGEALDYRSDFYSLGCVMFEALTSKPPFSGDNPIKIILAHIHDQPGPMARQSDAGKDLEDIVMTCLEKDPVNRYQRAGQLIDDLKSIQAGKIPRTVRQLRARLKARRFCTKALRIFIPVLCVFAMSFPAIWIVFFTGSSWMKTAGQAQVLIDTGSSNYFKAEGLYKKALADATEHRAKDMDREYLLYELGKLYYLWERRKDAVAAFEQSKAVGVNHPPTLVTSACDQSLCRINTDWSRLGLAAKQGEEALTIRRTFFAERPTLVVDTLYQLSHIYILQEKYDKAQAADREAIQILAKLDQASHSSKLGNCYLMLFEAVFKDLASAGESSHGQDVPGEQEKIDEVVKAARKVAQIELTNQGPVDKTRQNGQYMSGCLGFLGRFQEAEEIAKMTGAGPVQFTFTRAGMTLLLNKTFEIQSVLADGPAYKAGLRNGDQILEIDGMATKEMKGFKLYNTFHSQKGRKSAIIVDRNGKKVHCTIQVISVDATAGSVKYARDADL